MRLTAVTSGFRRISNPAFSRSFASSARVQALADRDAFKEYTEKENTAIARQIKRNWNAGDVYAPHDLSAAEARKWSKRHEPTTDAFAELNLNPLKMYKNFSVMAEYVTDMGRIRPAHGRDGTGLRRVTQRKLAKAIRRAQALGLVPSVYKHPEILKRTHEAGLINGGRLS